MNDMLSRRELLSVSGAAALAAASIAATPQARGTQRRPLGPNDKITLGIIGLAGRGFGYHMNVFGKFPDVQIGAVCDVYAPRVERAVAATGGKAHGYSDFRKLLEQQDLDAVVVATPPHWHALITLAALEAGKDVLCEKPMCRFPEEGRLMAEFARRYGRVTQVGTQIHATPNYHRCVNVVRSGALGRVTAVRSFCTMNDDSEGLGSPPDSPPPPGLDWDMWLGPAPKVAFNTGRFRDGMHRYFKDYVDSWLHELGPHIVDLPVWALDLKAPLAVSAAGGRYATRSIADVPDTLDVIWEYPGLQMTWTMNQANAFPFGIGGPGPGRRIGTIFQGTDATLVADYGRCEVYDNAGKLVERTDYPAAAPPSPGHEREFLDCIRTRRQPSCSFENHLPLHLALNLGHVALKAGRRVRWDAARSIVIGDGDAQRLTRPNYRGPWKLP
jgi:predicted dehydrogenase